MTSDHIGGPRCKGVRDLNTIECIAKGLTYLESYYAYFCAANRCKLYTSESQFPRILHAVPQQDNVSAEAWSSALHVATSSIKTDLWYDLH